MHERYSSPLPLRVTRGVTRGVTRRVGAPAGTKGISLFLVPKHALSFSEEGVSLGDRPASSPAWAGVSPQMS